MLLLFYIDGSYITAKVIWARGVVPLTNTEFEAFMNTRGNNCSCHILRIVDLDHEDYDFFNDAD